MNLQLSEYTSDDTLRACNANNPKISETALDKKFDDKLCFRY